MAFHESHSRTFLKTVLYRVILILSNGLVIFLVTRQLDSTFESIGILAVLNTALYYFYERIWNSFHWGKSHRKKK